VAQDMDLSREHFFLFIANLMVYGTNKVLGGKNQHKNKLSVIEMKMTRCCIGCVVTRLYMIRLTRRTLERERE